MNFTCGVQCSQVDLVAWFVNGSTLSLFQDTGLNFQHYPGHSYCSTSQTISMENHTLSLMTNYDLGFPLDIDCVMISGCGEGVQDCISYTCSSESARFELQSKLYWVVHNLASVCTKQSTIFDHYCNTDDCFSLICSYTMYKT